MGERGPSRRSRPPWGSGGSRRRPGFRAAEAKLMGQVVVEGRLMGWGSGVGSRTTPPPAPRTEARGGRTQWGQPSRSTAVQARGMPELRWRVTGRGRGTLHDRDRRRAAVFQRRCRVSGEGSRPRRSLGQRSWRGNALGVTRGGSTAPPPPPRVRGRVVEGRAMDGGSGVDSRTTKSLGGDTAAGSSTGAWGHSRGWPSCRKRTNG